jgi:ATP-binding cassette subfamily F protein 3
VDKPKAEHKINLSLSSQDRSGNDVFRLENVTFTIGDKLLAKEVNLYCGYRDRICLLGQNGSGKTTLLKLMLGKQVEHNGIVKMGASLRVGYYDQYQNELDELITVFDTIKAVVPMATDGYILGWLARFGFTDLDVQKQVSVLSGGEKSRLYLSLLIHAKPNLLVLDEPTNHLDIRMMDALLDALQDYDGTIVFVSHDRFFIKELASKYWVFHRTIQSGDLYPTIAEMDKPFEELLQIAYGEPEVEKPKTEQVRNRIKKVNPWILEQLHNEIEQEQANLYRLQEDLQAIHAQLSDSDTYAKADYYKELQTSMQIVEAAITDTESKIEIAENKFLELSYDIQ